MKNIFLKFKIIFLLSKVKRNHKKKKKKKHSELKTKYILTNH